jgi:hypothetical protein
MGGRARQRRRTIDCFRQSPRGGNTTGSPGPEVEANRSRKTANRQGISRKIPHADSWNDQNGPNPLFQQGDLGDRGTGTRVCCRVSRSQIAECHGLSVLVSGRRCARDRVHRGIHRRTQKKRKGTLYTTATRKVPYGKNRRLDNRQDNRVVWICSPFVLATAIPVVAIECFSQSTRRRQRTQRKTVMGLYRP